MHVDFFFHGAVAMDILVTPTISGSYDMQSKYFIAIQLYTYMFIIWFDFWLTSETEGHMIALVTGSTPANNVKFCSFFVFEFSNFQNYKFCIKHAAEYMQLNTLLLG